LITAKLLALAYSLPLVPISTLHGLAQQVHAQVPPGQKIRVILPACRGDISTTLFSPQLERLEPDHPVKPEENKTCRRHYNNPGPLANAKAIADLAKSHPAIFDRAAIHALVPAYSHSARVNKSARPELQHLKIGLA
jgi:tRNA A37 threonylcarbamoyladenosine modification protein TsaB